MAAPEDSTNLTLIKVGRFGRVKVDSKDGKKNEDAAAFKRLMVKMQEEAGPGGYLHGRGALDHDDVLYLKEQRAAELDAERMRDHNEKRAYLAFRAAADQMDAQGSSPLLVEPKTRSGIRQQSFLKNIVEVKPKRQKKMQSDLSSSSDGPGPSPVSAFSQGGGGDKTNLGGGSPRISVVSQKKEKEKGKNTTEKKTGIEKDKDKEMENVTEKEKFLRQSSGSTLLGLSYEGSDDDEEGEDVEDEKNERQEEREGFSLGEKCSVGDERESDRAEKREYEEKTRTNEREKEKEKGNVKDEETCLRGLGERSDSERGDGRGEGKVQDIVKNNSVNRRDSTKDADLL